MSTIDLFGNTIEDKLPGGKMCQRYIEPPFTTLDQRSGRWQDRKRDWKQLGIKGEVGRGDAEGGERLTWVSGSRSKEIRATKAEMKERVIKTVSCFNGGLDNGTYQANALLFRLKLALDDAMKEGQGDEYGSY